MSAAPPEPAGARASAPTHVQGSAVPGVSAIAGAAALTLLNPTEWNTETCAEVNARLEHASPGHIADWAVATFGRDLAVASSMQTTVLPHLFASRLPGIDIVFLDTGYHFPETLATRDETARRLPITVVNATPKKTVAEQDAERGPQLHGRDPNLCCALRKVEPLRATLSGYKAWATGARRADASTRTDLAVVAWDATRGMVKVNPLATMSDEAFERYQEEHDLPRHPLMDQGYPSIGCAPCTRRVEPGEDRRAGRWAGTDKMECGIHI